MVDDNDITRADEAVRGLVRRAYDAAQEDVAIDIDGGLRKIRDQARERLSIADSWIPPGAPLAGRSRTGAGELTAMSVHGGMRMARRAGASIVFGRNTPQVHVPLGVSDKYVSRIQGELICRGDQWWLVNRGRTPIRVGAHFLETGDDWGPVPDGATQVFVIGHGAWQHMLALQVAGAEGRLRLTPRDDVTTPPRMWPLRATERLALVVVFQDYLRGDSLARPIPGRRAAEQLASLDADGDWTPARVERVVNGLRKRLTNAGVPGLTREDDETASQDALQHRLIRELMRTTTLEHTDLWLLESTG